MNGRGGTGCGASALRALRRASMRSSTAICSGERTWPGVNAKLFAANEAALVVKRCTEVGRMGGLLNMVDVRVRWNTVPKLVATQRHGNTHKEWFCSGTDFPYRSLKHP